MSGQCMAPGCSSAWAYRLEVEVAVPKAEDDTRGYGDTITVAKSYATYCEVHISGKATELMRVLWSAA